MGVRRLTWVMAALVAAACGSDSGLSGPRDDAVPTPGGGAPPATGMLVSGAVPRSLVPSAPGTGGSLVYVAATPASFPGAKYARLVSSRGDSAIARAFDGGFDPRPVRGEDGDVVTVTVVDSAGHETTTHLPARAKPPRVVRTSPAAQRTDVPLNIRIAVVFSAPMDAASVAAGVHLLRDGDVVPGEVRLSPDGLAVEIVPATALAASADYELRVDDAVRDVLGQRLEDEVRVAFRSTSGADTTSAYPASAGAWSLVVYPWRHSEPSWHDPAGGRYWRPRALFPGDTIWLRASRSLDDRDSLVASWQNMTPGVVQVKVMPSGREAYAVAIAPGTAEVRATTARTGLGATDDVGALRLQVFEPMPASMLAGVRIDIARDASLVFRQEVDGTAAVPLSDASSLVSGSVWWLEFYSGYGAYLPWRHASVRPDGRLAASRGGGVSVTDVIGGALRTLAPLPWAFETGCPVWSPNGRYIAVTAHQVDVQLLHIIDTETGTVRERSSGGFATCPVWHPDGTRLIFNQPLTPWSWVTGSSYQVLSVSREGDSLPVELFRDVVAGPFASDGGALLVVDLNGNLYRFSTDGEQRAFIAAVARVSPVAWSADGRLVAMPYYIMSADGRYARNVDGEILGFAP